MTFVNNRLVGQQAECFFKILCDGLNNSYSGNPNGIFAEPFAFYNGRERWAGIRFDCFRGNRMSLYVIFGENRNSDNFCVQTWEAEPTLNPPTVVDMSEGSYEARRYYPPFNYWDALEYVMSLIHNWLASKELVDT